MFGGVQRKGAPAGPDLEHVIAGFQTELLADPLELGNLRLLQRRAGTLEDRARVAERRVEHPLEQLVPKVVVGSDVSAAAGARTPTPGRGEHPRGDEERRNPLARTVKGAGVERRQADQGNQVRRIPEPLLVGIGEAARSIEKHRPNAAGTDLHSCGRRTGSEPDAAVALDDNKASRPDSA